MFHNMFTCRCSYLYIYTYIYTDSSILYTIVCLPYSFYLSETDSKIMKMQYAGDVAHNNYKRYSHLPFSTFRDAAWGHLLASEKDAMWSARHPSFTSYTIQRLLRIFFKMSYGLTECVVYSQQEMLKLKLRLFNI